MDLDRPTWRGCSSTWMGKSTTARHGTKHSDPGSTGP